MPTEYDLISPSAREGYELGAGPWGEPGFESALRSTDPVGEVFALMVEDGFEPQYAKEIAAEIATFTATHPDWKVVDDSGGWDGAVVAGEWRAVLADEGRDPTDELFPLYHRVGSRHQEKDMPVEGLTERQREVLLKHITGKEGT